MRKIPLRGSMTFWLAIPLKKLVEQGYSDGISEVFTSRKDAVDHIECSGGFSEIKLFQVVAIAQYVPTIKGKK